MFMPYCCGVRTLMAAGILSTGLAEQRSAAPGSLLLMWKMLSSPPVDRE